MQINPPVVFTFTRQRWSSTTFAFNLPRSCEHQIQFFTRLRCLHSSRSKPLISVTSSGVTYVFRVWSNFSLLWDFIYIIMYDPYNLHPQSAKKRMVVKDN